MSTATSHLLIADVAKAIGVSPSTLRRWEGEGIIPPARRRRSYRIYTSEDVEHIRQVIFEEQAESEVAV